MRFAMGLACRLGRTLGELLGLEGGAVMSPFEWSLWIVWCQEYDPDRPSGENQRREDWRFGMLLALTKNLNMPKGRFAPKDFFPSLAIEENPSDNDRDLEARAMARAGKVIRHKKDGV